jgi:hypothetical protein
MEFLFFLKKKWDKKFKELVFKEWHKKK